MSTTSYLSTIQHHEHRQWLSKLDFYQDEIKIFQQELLLVLHRHPNYLSIIEHVEEYSQILLKKLERIDLFRRQIILHEKQLTALVKTDAEEMGDHEQMRTTIEGFFIEFEAMKPNFRRFVAYND